MFRSASPRLQAYAAVAALALVCALAAGRPELVALAIPFVLFVGLSLAWSAPPVLEGELRFERERLLEGERVGALVTVRNRGGGARVELHLPASVHLQGDPVPRAFWLEPGEQREVRFELDAGRWGIHRAGPAMVRARDRLGVFAIEGRLGTEREVRAYPQVDRLRRLVAPLRTRPMIGSQVSRERGDGIEFADLRPLVPGDRAANINWRATARRRTPYVNVHHPEHSADVVLFLDTFAQAERENEGTLDAAVRAASALASAYLARRDRVALVSFGGTLEWLTPGLGVRQQYRIVDALLSSAVRPSTRAREVSHLPRRLLPAGALVIGLSPLLDPRGLVGLLDLRARGYDLVVLEVSPLAHTPLGDDAGDDLAFRLWRLQRDALRARFEALGVPVGVWHHPHASLELAIEEVITYRRHARPAPRA